MKHLIDNNSFLSFKHTGEERVMYLSSNNIEFVIYYNADDVIE